MSEAHGHPIPDVVETDPAALSSSEDLDEDRLRVDPLEEGVEPPERYAHSDRFGTTPGEEHEGESLGDRLRQEQPDVQPDDVPERPVAATPADELDETIDDTTADADPVEEPFAMPEDREGRVPSVEEDQNADKPGGSVAQTIRTPPEP
ncbi:MAG TPA: hypothetical protein VJT49_00240 [Amycolatopsis sp.]|uniref:hypothetical protein n=1 Tax=Amycolatopsis sp. TaxID=37632 RepID=UPI002B494D5D|nr:hypothetical protein [Amycolatopsis sp.]HKS43543.1 hypothetical protein [Amycolatopsis sp.]